MADGTSPEPKKAASDAKAGAAQQKMGGKSAVLGVVLSALIAGGAAFAGARVAAGGSAPSPEAPKMEPPGPTLGLDPFIANVIDRDGKARAVKITIGAELSHDKTEEDTKVFVPRIRDVTLSYVRSLTFEQISDPAHADPMRADLLERWHGVGAIHVRRVLITDLIVQ